MSRSLLADKILGKLSQDELLKLASEKLTDAEVQELTKEADILSSIGDAAKGVAGQAQLAGKTVAQAGQHMFAPSGATNAAVSGGAAGPAAGALARVGEAGKHVAGLFGSGEGAMHGGAQAAVALPVLYMLAQKAGLIGNQDQNKMASYIHPDVTAHVEKLAQDPAVVSALAILLQRNLL